MAIALAILQALPVVIPLLMQLITMVEQLAKQGSLPPATSSITPTPAPMTGADKKANVLAAFEALWANLATQAPTSVAGTVAFSDLQPVVAQLIDTIVAAFNALGVFAKGT